MFCNWKNTDKYGMGRQKKILGKVDLGWLLWTQSRFSITPVFSRHVLLEGASASHVFKSNLYITNRTNGLIKQCLQNQTVALWWWCCSECEPLFATNGLDRKECWCRAARSLQFRKDWVSCAWCDTQTSHWSSSSIWSYTPLTLTPPVYLQSRSSEGSAEIQSLSVCHWGAVCRL